MDLLHHAFKVLFRGSLLVSAERLPSEIHRVLDVGTGTGIWAIEMADQHPGAEIVGTDLSPIQPNWVTSFQPVLTLTNVLGPSELPIYDRQR